MFRWFAVQTFTTAEFKVKQDLERHAKEGRIRGFRQVVVPTEPVEEVKGGQKVTTQKRTMPGYVLVQMEPNPVTLKVVRATKGVIDFVGGDRLLPAPLSPAEVEQILHRKGDDDSRPKVVLDVSIGETVTVAQGPFDGFSGEVAEVNEDGAKLKVLVEIFGRPTPVEVAFEQVKLAA